MDIHNYEKMYLGRLEYIRKAKISERNKKTILDFNNALILQNISKPRLMKYLWTLKMIAQTINKDFEDATIDDIKSFVALIQSKNYSPHTKLSYKIIIKRFYKWLKNTEGYPDMVKWISIKMSRCERRLPSEDGMLTEEDVQNMIRSAYHPRDKAFVSILWESGCRVSEIGNLTLNKIAFDKNGIVMNVHGKTGSRKIRLISSTPHLSTWINMHPFRDNPESPLWITIGPKNHNKPINYPGLRKSLRIIAEKADIKKRINPHSFRHGRATFMANHLTEFQMNQYFGWVQGSDMPSTYVHLSGKEVDNAIFEMNGIKVESNKDEIKIQPKICPRCDTINAYDSKHCNKCGGIIDLKYAMELEAKKEVINQDKRAAEEMIKLLLTDSKVREFLAEKMKNLGISPN